MDVMPINQGTSRVDNQHPCLPHADGTLENFLYVIPTLLINLLTDSPALWVWRSLIKHGRMRA